ncbi:MAG: regulatory protein RecX, partial [Sporichthyaceae bacterium]
MTFGGTRRRSGRRPRTAARIDDGQDGPPQPEADPESVARAIVLRKLTMAPKTRAQLADDLRSRAVPDDVAERVLDRFSAVGLVDDEAFAQAWVSSRHTSRGLARRALSHELRHRGVADETVDEAVDAISPDDEWAAARDLVARRLPASRGLPREARMRRLAGMLARKGYSGGLAMAVVRDALATEASGVTDESE